MSTKWNEFYDIGSIQQVFHIHKCAFTFNSFIILFPKFSVVVKVVIYLVTNHFICTFKFSYVQSCKLSLWFLCSSISWELYASSLSLSYSSILVHVLWKYMCSSRLWMIEKSKHMHIKTYLKYKVVAQW